MRIWSLHPQYLDAKGLVALWREGLLAQKVLLGETKGYRNHPQLTRFKNHPDPLAAIGVYLREVRREAVRRGYHFNAGKILRTDTGTKIRVTDGQVVHELAHLSAKLKKRDREAYERLEQAEHSVVHPLFQVVSGGIENWEVV
jgi:hypothetical protein